MKYNEIHKKLRAAGATPSETETTRSGTAR